MADEHIITNLVKSYTSGTPGRSLNNARMHHLVVDGPPYAGGPGEELTPAEVFLSGVSACAVLLVERAAQQSGVPFQRAEVAIEGLRDTRDIDEVPAHFENVKMRFELWGPVQRQAEELVATYQHR
ncbi:MAG: OsmC family protein [Dehalococcoidia bacterium]